VTEDDALLALDKFSERWDGEYPQISRNTLFDYPEDIRKAIYTTNAIESVNSVIRKVIKKRKLFHRMMRLKKLSIWQSKMHQKDAPCPSDNTAKKVVCLAIQDPSKN